MNRKSLVRLGFAILVCVAPGIARAQIGPCTVGLADCSIETRLPGKDLCADGVDNDGNGFTDANDMHCQSEVLCQDGFDNDAEGGIDNADPDCQCMDGAYGQTTVCTANDLAISYTASPLVSDGCINSTDNVIAQLFATITLAQADRYNLGLWVALDGSSAKTGSSCTRQTPQPVSVSPDALNPAGTGPFYTLDGNACGDGPSTTETLYKFPYNIDVSCTDIFVSGESAQDGFIDLGQCGSWDNNAGGCTNPGNTLPNTKSKCRCARAESGIPGPNIRTACTNFAPQGVGPTLDPGETAQYTFEFTNSVTGCTSGAEQPGDPFGRNRCGTASFVRFAIEYGTADDRGDFYYNNGGGDVAVPTCPTTAVVNPNLGVLCNDTANDRLIWAPRDPNSPNAYGVVSAPGGTISLPFRYTLTDTSTTAPVSLTARTYWDNEVDTSPQDDAISDAEAIDLTGAILQTCADCACSNTAQATPITLSSFEATPAGRAVVFDWSTETEVGNVGFDLYATVGKQKVKLNDEPIPAASIDSLEPQSYSVILDVPEGADGFVLEDLDLRGRARAHGPFKSGKAYGSKLESTPVDWASVRREHGLRRGENSRAIGRHRGASSSADLRTAGDTSNARGGGKTGGTPVPRIEILVDRDGLYRVTYEQLLAAGFDLGSESASQLELSAAGRPVPMFVSAGAKFGPGSYLEFWGEALDTLYTTTNVYRLATGQKRPARASEVSLMPSGSAATSYSETRRFERDRGYAVWSQADDPFFDTEMLVFTSPGDWQFPFSIDGYVAGSGPVVLRAGLFGGTSIANVAPDHHIEVLLNGVVVGDATFDATEEVSLEATVPDGILLDGANTMTVRLTGDTGAPYDLVSLDHFSISYPRSFDAISGALVYSGGGTRFDVTGLPSAEVVAYRMATGALEHLSGVTVTPDGSGFMASVPGAGSGRYAVASASALLAPATIQVARTPAGDLRSGAATLLVISHGAFLDGLDPFVAARSAQGYSVKVVDVEDIYSDFRHGVYDARAIQDYVAWAHANLGTRFVLLVGGDTYDYQNHLGLAPVSFIPSLYRATGEIVGYAPSDPSYADVDGDDRQDLAIGRWPVRTRDELDQVIAKTLAYDTKAYVDTGIFAADYLDAGANEAFSTASDRVVDKLPSGWEVDRIYLDQMTLADARAGLLADLAEGAALTHYVGHSGPTSWGSSLVPASQHLFRIGDVSSLGNAGRPTVVSQLGCWNVYYASPRSESLGARLLLEADRGAAAVLGAATLTEDLNSNRFGAILAPMLSEPGATLGEAVLQAKQTLADQATSNDDLRDILLGWTLLGDPTLSVSP